MNKKQLKYWNKGFKTAFILATIVYGIALILIIEGFSNQLEEIIENVFNIKY